MKLNLFGGFKGRHRANNSRAHGYSPTRIFRGIAAVKTPLRTRNGGGARANINARPIRFSAAIKRQPSSLWWK